MICLESFFDCNRFEVLRGGEAINFSLLSVSSCLVFKEEGLRTDVVALQIQFAFAVLLEVPLLRALCGSRWPSCGTGAGVLPSAWPILQSLSFLCPRCFSVEMQTDHLIEK